MLNGIPQKRQAYIFGVSVRTIQMWKSGKRSPSKKHQCAIDAVTRLLEGKESE